MTKKKNRLFTFFCSLLPGAGEMYLGFFKHGLSVMTIFFLLMFFSSVLFPPLMFLAPVLWFYSFFHVNHLITLPDDEFYMIEDDYFLHVCLLYTSDKNERGGWPHFILTSRLSYFGPDSPSWVRIPTLDR